MGRTNPTYRNRLDSFMQKFGPFRRALRQKNKKHLDELWEKAHSFASAGAYMNSTQPGTTALISMMLGIQRDINRIENRIEDLEEEPDVQG